MPSEPIHIAFCVNDAYVPYICVTIKSIAENNRNREICIHVLTDAVSDSNRMRLNEVLQGYAGLSLQIHTVDDSPLRGLRTGNLTLHTWYRILLPEVLSPEIMRVLYLDADTIVTDCLDDLFDLDMDGVAVAGSLDPQSFSELPYERCGYEKSKQYICAGGMLINLVYWREHGLTEKIIDYARLHNERLIFQDQDAINYICRDSKIVLPFRYGSVLWFFYMASLYDDALYREQLNESLCHPAIIHYIGCHPWQKEVAVRHMMHDRWVMYNRMLKHPVKCHYETTLWTVVKSSIYKLLHRSELPTVLTVDDVKCRLSDYSSGNSL